MFPRRGARAACVALLPGDCVTRLSYASTLTNRSATIEPEWRILADDMLYFSLLSATTLLRKCNSATSGFLECKVVLRSTAVWPAALREGSEGLPQVPRVVDNLVALEAEGALNLCSYIFK